MKKRRLLVVSRQSSVKTIFFVAVFLLFTIHYSLFTDFAFASQSDDEVLRIQKAYEGIKDIRGSFIQKSYIKDLKRTDTYNGQFFIKSQKVKWEYKGEKPQIVYILGDEIIIYQPKEKQAFKARFDRATYGQAPIALLSGFGNITNEFDVTIKKENRAQKTEQRLLLKPKKPMGNIASVEIATSSEEFPIESLTIIDTLSNRIDIYLKGVKINTGLKDKLFEFTPPEGTVILQQ